MIMPDEEKEDFAVEKPVGRLSGKTTQHTVTVLLSNPSVERNNYLVIYGERDNEEDRIYYVLTIIDMWSDSKGFMAKIAVIGERPKRPFEIGSEVYLAKEEQISKILGIFNPPEESILLGKLIGYPYDVQLLVKNFGRIFITGKSGSGKSYTMSVLCEEFLLKGIPVVILDRHGEYGSLKVASEDLGEGDSEFVDRIIEFSDLKKNRGGDIDIEYLFSLSAADLVAPNLCTIVNLNGLSLEVQEMIAGKLLKKLYDASTTRKIPPFYLFLDEAHLFAGKKQTETCDVVKLFAQEGRKFGANIVIGTQRPQLLDTTIRAQAGTWVVHNLSDIRDIGITISSAEDLSSENKSDISGLDKGESIVCGEAAKGIPLFVKVRKRKTKHGGVGFNPLDFLSEQTVEELQKRKNRILGGKSADELETGKSVYQEMMEPKSSAEYLDEIASLKVRIKDLEDEVSRLKQKVAHVKEGKNIPLIGTDEVVQELQTEIEVWKEKYKYIKEMAEKGEGDMVPFTEDSGALLDLNNRLIEKEAQLKKYKSKYDDALILAEKTLAELKKKGK
ncbi:MAG: AAA-like domain protein [Candidatus Lokiarchaeum sp. GC14_75]|nr:MAG: AAA-like domain protein [Candidatus Lokiarchaeum sp. GC14_75]